MLLGCAPMTHAPDAPTPTTDASETQADAIRVAMPDANAVDASVQADAIAVNEDAHTLRYERDVRPVLEASRCGSCHAEFAVEMSYAWIRAAGTTWCRGETYAARWSCFETHARTQTTNETTGNCSSSFYHRHGEPCFSESERATVLAWAAGGFAE